jgi:hypothetical protein
LRGQGLGSQCANGSRVPTGTGYPDDMLRVAESELDPVLGSGGAELSEVWCGHRARLPAGGEGDVESGGQVAQGGPLGCDNGGAEVP